MFDIIRKLSIYVSKDILIVDLGPTRLIVNAEPETLIINSGLEKFLIFDLEPSYLMRLKYHLYCHFCLKFNCI